MQTLPCFDKPCYCTGCNTVALLISDSFSERVKIKNALFEYPCCIIESSWENALSQATQLQRVNFIIADCTIEAHEFWLHIESIQSHFENTRLNALIITETHQEALYLGRIVNGTRITLLKPINQVTLKQAAQLAICKAAE
ncbi:hypothetical protein NBRC116494_01750 [Aurantivibrio plasticivorans]